MYKTWKHALVLGAVFALPAAAAAQEAPAPAPAEAAAPAPTTAREVEDRLVEIRRLAMETPEMQAAQAALNDAVTAAMVRLDPAMAEKIARAEAMPAEIAAATEAQDNETLTALAAEAEALQAAFGAARAQAMQDEAVLEARRAFQQQVFAAMVQTDPQTEALLSRLRELQGGQ